MQKRQKLNRVTMPKWPAWVLFGTMAACAYPAVSASADHERPAVQTAEQPGSLASTFVR